MPRDHSRLLPSVTRGARRATRHRSRRAEALPHALAVAAALAAAAGFLIADADGNVSRRSLALLLSLHVAVTVSAAVWLHRLVRRIAVEPVVSPLLLALIAAGVVWEPLQRWLWSTGRPFEMLVMFNLKNLTLGLAAVAFQPRAQRLALLAGLFLTVFSAAVTTDAGVHVCTALFAVAGVLWMIVAYWDSLHDRLLAHHHATRPRRSAALTCALFVMLIVLAPAGGNQMATAFRGLAPGSGGSGAYDAFARNGVGNGDALVAGSEQIQSFAPLEDAPFISDEHPALYDIFNDTYEPPCVTKHQDRAVSLPPELARELQQRMARSQVAQREFSTLRKAGRERRHDVSDLASDALLYVAGRTPLHLRLELYDVFDGVTWYPEAEHEAQPPLRMEERGGKPWLIARTRAAVSDCFQGPERHIIRVVRLNTNRIPAPVHLSGVHIDLVERLDLFRWCQDGIVQMQRITLPEAVPIHLASDVLDTGALADEFGHFGIMRSTHVGTPRVRRMHEVRRLAEAWAAGLPRGWAQVEAVTARLRESCAHDRAAARREDSEFPVAEFLLHTRRGPDYLFASAAAVMLRSLGYSTRVVSGFYARPEKYDPRSRHTAVHRDDVHFWAEVYVGAGTWATVEATPGYDVLGPPPGTMARIVDAIAAAAVRARRHWIGLSASLAAIVILTATRWSWLDACYTLEWRWSARRTTRRHVLATWRLLEWRLRVAGAPRPGYRTPAAWCRTLHAADAEPGSVLAEVARWTDWARFAPDRDRRSIVDEHVVRATCRAAVLTWTLPQLCQLARRTNAGVMCS